MDKINNIPINNMSQTSRFYDKTKNTAYRLILLKGVLVLVCVQYVIQFIITGAFIFFIALCATLFT